VKRNMLSRIPEEMPKGRHTRGYIPPVSHEMAQVHGIERNRVSLKGVPGIAKDLEQVGVIPNIPASPIMQKRDGPTKMIPKGWGKHGVIPPSPHTPTKQEPVEAPNKKGKKENVPLIHPNPNPNLKKKTLTRHPRADPNIENIIV
jgi:hypothetical protein